jgi:hypothetical protein
LSFGATDFTLGAGCLKRTPGSVSWGVRLEERLAKSKKDFLTDEKSLRENARKNMRKGPATDTYGADVKKVIGVLNLSLATEIACVIRYRQHSLTA